jgi:hypothetical protein
MIADAQVEHCDNYIYPAKGALFSWVLFAVCQILAQAKGRILCVAKKLASKKRIILMNKHNSLNKNVNYGRGPTAV